MLFPIYSRYSRIKSSTLGFVDPDWYPIAISFSPYTLNHIRSSTHNIYIKSSNIILIISKHQTSTIFDILNNIKPLFLVKSHDDPIETAARSEISCSLAVTLTSLLPVQLMSDHVVPTGRGGLTRTYGGEMWENMGHIWKLWGISLISPMNI